MDDFFLQVLSSPTFRCFTSKDVIGVEVGGAVKNVIALAAGMCEGLGLGASVSVAIIVELRSPTRSRSGKRKLIKKRKNSRDLRHHQYRV